MQSPNIFLCTSFMNVLKSSKTKIPSSSRLWLVDELYILQIYVCYILLCFVTQECQGYSIVTINFYSPNILYCISQVIFVPLNHIIMYYWMLYSCDFSFDHGCVCVLRINARNPVIYLQICSICLIYLYAHWRNISLFCLEQDWIWIKFMHS